jgi:hypothetical protein
MIDDPLKRARLGEDDDYGNLEDRPYMAQGFQLLAPSHTVHNI